MALSHAPGASTKSALPRGKNPAPKLLTREGFVIPAKAGIQSDKRARRAGLISTQAGILYCCAYFAICSVCIVTTFCWIPRSSRGMTTFAAGWQLSLRMTTFAAGWQPRRGV